MGGFVKSGSAVSRAIRSAKSTRHQPAKSSGPESDSRLLFVRGRQPSARCESAVESVPVHGGDPSAQQQNPGFDARLSHSSGRSRSGATSRGCQPRAEGGGADCRDGADDRRQGSSQPGDVAQLGEHLLCKQGVGGSSPLISTTHIDNRIESLEISVQAEAFKWILLFTLQSLRSGYR